MNINDIKIPKPLQVVMDDMGWMEGRTPYWEHFMPSRTGIPRRHTIEDYVMINEIGKSINMKINAMFVIGDWDKNNIMRKITCATRLGEKWDSSAFLNIAEAEEMRDFLNSCEYIELGIHGLHHEAWDGNGEHIGAEFVLPKEFKKDNDLEPVPEWYLREHLDAFMEIYNDWGITQKIRSFSCPGHCLTAWKDGVFPRVLKDYGVKYWHQHCIEGTYVESDVIMNHKSLILAPWEAFDLNPDKLPTYEADKAGILSSHWPNYLRYDPEENLKNLEKWTAFFNRQAEVFGMILSRDIAFAHNQLLYTNNCTIEEVDGKIKIDLTKADEIMPEGSKAPLYVSIKSGSDVPRCEGGIMTEYETCGDFKNYKIERTDSSIIYVR